jgi:beta-1,4-mannosyltransferase
MVFVAVASQRDNLGDSLLRRPLIRAAQAIGECHVFVGRGAEDWTNLGIRSVDTLYSSRRRWLVALGKSAVSKRTTLLLNAGELVFDRRFRLTRLSMAPAIALIKIRGGSLIHAGFGLRDPQATVPLAARATVRMSDIVSWRDEAARAAVGTGTVAPDWAYGEGASISELERRHATEPVERVIAISLRGDRPAPSSEWIASIRAAAETQLNARIVIVCQVRRDSDRSAWLARALGADLVAWPDSATHADQEETVRKTYARATWVVSNRLHSVIMALTEGAVPLDLAPEQSRKVPRALAVIDLSLASAQGALARLSLDRSNLRAGLQAGRRRLDDLTEAIVDVANGRRGRALRVLHTIASPNRTTRYARHMAATEDFDVKPLFLGWRQALIGRFDVVHVHWPEHFVPAGSGVRARASRSLARVVIHRARRRKVPVVRTLHNITPHRGSSTTGGENLRKTIDRLTRTEIHLVSGDPNITGGETRLIPHGSYREPYADYVTEKAEAGRVLHFGRLEGYKGVPGLLEATLHSRVAQLRVVGQPADEQVTAAVVSAAERDNRISYTFDFVPDEDLALEISRASLCVFPYRELHSSGAILVALSMSRPILVPRTSTTEELEREVGPQWVRIYDALDSTELDAAVDWAAEAQGSGSRPDMSDRTWQLVRDRHASVARSVTGMHTSRAGEES